jgi:hypothetical protein
MADHPNRMPGRSMSTCVSLTPATHNGAELSVIIRAESRPFAVETFHPLIRGSGLTSPNSQGLSQLSPLRLLHPAFHPAILSNLPALSSSCG